MELNNNNSNENIESQEFKIENENININKNINIKSKYLSTMNEEEINIFLKKLNIKEEKEKELNNIIKNGKDLISLYNEENLLQKINLDLHDKNILKDAVEKYLEEQLKINIEIEKGKNIILSIENEPKYKLKEVYILLEKLFKKKIYLSPLNNPYEILDPNTLIVKKIISNPYKYCNLCLFNEDLINLNKNEKIETNNLDKKDKEIIKDYNNLFDNNINKKNTVSVLSDFSTNYQMPSQNKNKNEIKNNLNMNNISNLNNMNMNNGIKLNKNNKLLNEDFKYQNLLSTKDNKNTIEKENDNNNENNNIIKEPKPNTFNLINNTDFNINKNYFTQRNFNTKNLSNNNNDNGDMFQQIMRKRNEKNITSSNNNKEENISFIKKDNNNMNKTENRYDFIKYQDIEKENMFMTNKNNNKNIFNNRNNNSNNLLNQNKTEEINDINNLILKTQTPNQINNNINDDSDDILKALREKYSLQNTNVNNNNNISDDKINMDYKKEYKPKTPITEGRRIVTNDNLKFDFFNQNNSSSNNDVLENKFLNLNKNSNVNNMNDNLDNNKYNFMNKNKINNNNGFNMGIGIGKNRLNNNRPSPGLDFNNFQYKATGYKSSFGQNNNNQDIDNDDGLVEINGDNE